MKLSQRKSKRSHRILIVGLPGSGKSTLAAELAIHGKRLIWLNIENAEETLRKLPPEAQDRIEFVNIPDSASYPIAAQTLLVLFKTGKANICEIHGKIDCPICKKDSNANITSIDFSTLGPDDVVVLDTGTQLSYSILSYTLKDAPIEKKPERDDWGALRKYTEFFKSQFQGAQYNLIVTCNCQEAELEDGAMKLVPSFGSASMSANFASAFDHVIYTEVKNGKHRAFSSSTASPKVLTRSRSDFAIEKCAEMSLISLFVDDTAPTNPASPAASDSPGNKAVAGLANIQARLKAGVK